jgi:exodeoxyribonuclease III
MWRNRLILNPVKIVTWNVNSIRARIEPVLDWVEAKDPDVLCLQETKVVDQEFPEDEFGDLDYDVTFMGQRAYNGVAIISRDEAESTQRNLPTDSDDAQKRFLATTINGIRIINVYAPNGKELDSEPYAFKLDWYRRLRSYLDENASADEPVLICGDLNICPQDIDAYDNPARAPGCIFLSEPEREVYQSLLDWGFEDAFRALYPQERAYTWWDYRNAGFARNAGLRIDHFLLSPPLMKRLVDVTIDREQRATDNCSDHVPVILELKD